MTWDQGSRHLGPLGDGQGHAANGVTCREGELDLLLDHLEGHKVMLLVEASVV